MNVKFFLLRGDFEVFTHRGDRLHRWGVKLGEIRSRIYVRPKTTTVYMLAV